ncbi:MAG: hypothetical protein K2M46_01810 [Lachnospiraceae bacterium]|nr:hypothetical protein [Lachnospiraceae bacterium]
MPLLGYERWENFDNAVNRAMESCETAGKGAKRNGKDYMLTRYACYLIAQNSDVKTVT